jgi:hypothetical protein
MTAPSRLVAVIALLLLAACASRPVPVTGHAWQDESSWGEMRNW